ncbi:ras association domain-containing protein 9 [Phlebotomus argentipes]|uniref:ras association domain-containing protein 9 n=1 Tax=Phlebotomus argentipes TaxID=94469 RepID=UPI002892F880|nr:ras association domain-containing protein 9 [Phlebotomus argentipes]XP_059615760.1 ras association domain-containing protein 9 [Phlebotomus argentipes]
MAPQNSTLLHENVAASASDLSRYSPILPHGQPKESPLRGKSICTSTTAIQPEADDEIPIWICGEPRYISGINEATTCRDLIQALIEDELKNTPKDVAASRDVRDYVITEKWRSAEQPLSGDTLISPLWLAWGEARNEVKFRLKIARRTEEKTSNKREKYKRLKKLVGRVLNQGKIIQEHLEAFDERNPSGKKILMDTFLEDTTKALAEKRDRDECDDLDSGVHSVGLKLENVGKSSTPVKKLSDFAIPPEFKRASLQFHTIRKEIVAKMYDLKTLLHREEELIEHLEVKNQEYKRQNEIYIDTDLKSGKNIERVQKNLQKCTEEIVKSEDELFRTKLEIQETHSIIEDLKSMMIESDIVSGFGEDELKRLFMESEFVDNINEFCDINDTIVV